MLKIIRQITETHPIIYQLIFMVIAVTFVISLGWWGFSSSGTSEVAQVGHEVIAFADYRQAYEARIRFYRERLKEELTEETFKHLGLDPRHEALNELIERKLWRQAGEKAGLRVNDAELQLAIAQVPVFQRGGQFDPALYRQVLAQVRMTPEGYEKHQREAYQGGKMRALVRDAVTLTAAELEDAKRATSTGNAAEFQRAVSDRLALKQDRAILAFTRALWTRATITIHEELL